MAILYGTQSNGETLPVLVDQFGNLLAKGIKGDTGDTGAEGPPGANGGDFPLPSDPYEGAFLGWLNGGLAWIGTPPVPIPDNVFGPITGWDPGGAISVEGDIPATVAQGVYVYQCNADGSVYVDGWNNSRVWSAGGVAVDPSALQSPIKNMFNGYNSDDLEGLTSIKKDYNVLAWEVNYPAGVFTDGAYIIIGPVSGEMYYELTFDDASTVSSDDIDVINVTPGDNSIYNWMIPAYKSVVKITGTNTGSSSGNTKAHKWNGKYLIDGGEYPIAPNLNLRVTTVSGQNIIGAANRTDNFTIGKYLRIPQQQVARWLYDGNLSKVITSTGIDISRLDAT